MWTGCEAGSAAACTCPRPSQGHRAPQGPSLLLPVFLLPTRQVEMSPCSEIPVGLFFFCNVSHYIVMFYLGHSMGWPLWGYK